MFKRKLEKKENKLLAIEIVLRLILLAAVLSLAAMFLF